MSYENSASSPTKPPRHSTPTEPSSESPSHDEPSSLVTTPLHSSQAGSVHSSGTHGGRAAPPNSISGVAPYGAFSKGVDHISLVYMPLEYEHLWRDPNNSKVTTPRARSPQTSPHSPVSLPVDKLDKYALATIPEGLELLPSARFVQFPKSSYTKTTASEDTTEASGMDALYLKHSSNSSLLPNRDVSFVTSSGVLEYSTWDIEAHDNMENALKRLQQLAVDRNKEDPSRSVESYYSAFVSKHLNDANQAVRYVSNEQQQQQQSPKADTATKDMKVMEAKIQELTQAVGELRSENVSMKREVLEAKAKANQVEKMIKTSDI